MRQHGSLRYCKAESMNNTVSDIELRKQVVEYVATGNADYTQIFTDLSCKIVKDDGVILVQVWVGIPDGTKLPEVDW